MGAVRVDHARHVIYSVYVGTFTASEFREHVSQINALGVGADYTEIIDLRAVTEFEISTSEWRQLARIALSA